MQTAHPRRQIKVLIVEDNELYRTFVTDTLGEAENADFQVDVCGRLSDAIHTAREEDYNVILLDLGLPDSQGAETAVSLRSEVDGVPIVVLTGRDDPSVALDTLGKAEVWNFLSKHVTDPQKLEDAVCDAALQTER